MRIGLSTLVIQKGKGGVGQYVLALVRALIRHTHPHHFILYVLEDDLPLFGFAKKAVTLVTVPEQWRSPIKNILWHQLQLPRLALHHELDLIHIPSYRRMIFSRPCATIATIHDLAPFKVPGKYDWKRMFYGRHVVKHLAKRVDEIIAVSEYTAHDINQFFSIPSKKITVIYNGIDHDRFKICPPPDAKAVVARLYGITGPFFLYVARLEHPAKNHVRLIAAFNQFRLVTRLPWKLVFAGSEWHGAEEIHGAVRQSPFFEDIHCVGFIPDEDLPTIYQAADIFIYPSLHEGFGLPPVEAMACGCPVICSANGSLREVVGNAAAIIDPENVTSITWQMTRFAKDANLRSEWRAAGLNRAKFFDWHKTAAATLQVYAEVTSEFRRKQMDHLVRSGHA